MNANNAANPCAFDLVAADLIDLLAMADAAPADCTAAPAHALAAPIVRPAGVRSYLPGYDAPCSDPAVMAKPKPLRRSYGSSLRSVCWSRWD